MGILETVDSFLFGARWITLKNKTRVRINSDGRVTDGGPPEWRGVHIEDIGEVSRKVRELNAIDCTSECDDCPRTFPNKAAGIAALLEANSDLLDFLETNATGSAETAMREYYRRGRRGPRPVKPTAGDGRFDALNEHYNLRGNKRISTWIEAIHKTVPGDRRWSAFEQNLIPLGEATGLTLNLPGPAFRARLQAATVEECERRRDQALDEIFTRARSARLQEPVPF